MPVADRLAAFQGLRKCQPADPIHKLGRDTIELAVKLLLLLSAATSLAMDYRVPP
jgi:hypothetical protein